MRHIDLGQLETIAKREALDELKAAEKELARKRTERTRKKYINDNYEKWTAIANFLWLLGNCKCWYSEALLGDGDGEVEHFRPKNNVWKSTHTGYWWLAFCVDNLRFACRKVNTRRTDFCTDEKAGKGCYFPIRGGDANRAFSKPDMPKERGNNVLLDPAVPADCRLLRFMENGRPEPEFSESDDAWKHRRALESIGYYHLDDGQWNRRRRNLMKEVSLLCDRLFALGPNDDEDELIDTIMEKIHPNAEFSSAAFQVVKAKGFYERVKGVGV